ncbi:MAG: hypothetical protein GWP08_04570 [Nitrospiraceae bacterium]|nr:hypothetical protein [Nitrospiraceae bacterium]
MTGCATTWQAGAPDGAIDVIAHRGASAYAPENTLAAFALAAELKADWFELDCTLSEDGEVIVIHDDSVDRTTDGEGRVSRLPLPELKKLDAGAWKAPEFAGERLPTLGEALDLAKERQIGVYVEIKNSYDDSNVMNKIIDMSEGHSRFRPSVKRQLISMIRDSGSRNFVLTQKAIEAIRERNMERQVVIQSFSPIICTIAQLEAPEIRTELLGGKDDKKPHRWPMYLRWAELLEVDGFNTNNGTLDKNLLAQFHADGMTAAVWTVDDEDDMRRLAQWGVDAIITNKPDVCLRVLEEEGKR